MSEKFNIGDKVRRITGEHNGMMVGDEDVVSRLGYFGNLSLEHFGIGHSVNSLEFVESITSTFKVGLQVKLKSYTAYSDCKRHDGESATIMEVEESSIQIKWEDETTSSIYFDGEANPYIVNNKLKNNKMDINDIKKLDKAILKKAKDNVLNARKEMQREQAEELLTELFNVKDAVEESIGENQGVLNDVLEDIKVFDVKK